MKLPERPRGPKEWNELEFLSWSEFQQMAPSIIQLEVSRLGKLIDSLNLDRERHNALVSARHRLRRFNRCVAQGTRETVSADCVPHLGEALLALAFPREDLAPESRAVLDYSVDRINDVMNRIRMIY